MPRPHAPFCDLPDGRDHGQFCISRAVAREAVAVTEAGKPIDITVDLAVRRTDRDGTRLVRVIGEPPDIAARFVALLPSGTARQVAAALVVAADQADELDRDVSAQLRADRSALP
jgi:hypothetical protein